MARYESGETLSSIARTYDCSPPAISYIVSRSKAKPAGDVSAQPTTEAHLVKSTGGSMTNGSANVEPTIPVAAPPSTAAAMIRREPVGDLRPAVPPNGASANGDQGRTLHLGLGGNSNGNGHGPVTVGANGGGNGYGHEAPRPNIAVPRPPQPQIAGEHMEPRPFQAPPSRNAASFDAGRNGRDLFAMPEGRPMAQQPREAEPGRKENGSFIDHELRSRVDGDIAAFLTAFDAALEADTQESRFGLREATDRLLRAGARTRIELERLEARVPLSPREGAAASNSGAWRQR